MRSNPAFTVIPILLSLLVLACSSQKSPVKIMQLTDPTQVTGIAVDGNTVYCSTRGGLVTWDIVSKKYTVATTKDGLPTNNLNTVIIDGKGTLWIATDLGLIARDGSSWKLFGTSQGLPSQVINNLNLDNKKNLWVSTAKGAAFFKNGSFSFLSDKEGPGSQDVLCILIDSGNNMWIGTRENGVYMNIQGAWRNTNTRHGLLTNAIQDITKNWDNSMWVTSVGVGVTRWDGYGWQGFSSKRYIGTFDIRQMQGSREQLWFFTSNGVHAMKGAEFTNYIESEGLISNDVTCGVVESDDRVYVGTNRGMSIIDKGHIINYSIPNIPFGNDFTALGVDNHNRLLAGSKKIGLNVLDSGSWALIQTQEPSLLKNIRSIIYGPDSTLICNTETGIVFNQGLKWDLKTRDDGIAGNDIRCSVFDRKGCLWVGTPSGISSLAGGRWTRIRADDGIPSEDVWACALDSTGTVWFGTAGGIVSISDSLVNWSTLPALKGLDVRSAAAVGNKVYFGAASGKLVVYDGKSWDTFGKGTLRITTPITAITADPSGVIWLGTAGDGIVRLEGKKAEVYTIRDGLPSNEVRALLFYNGKLWAACYGGLGVVDMGK
ncbi:MAG: two-component regulator propeller domain-containing protein [Candidatus Latescibacter sp.]|nr:two-component regulator propeller domain-containing protein [Candidatus Latescibacter sp.]